MVDGGGGTTQSETTPFNTKSSNSTSPLENWNLTDLLKVTAGTVIVLEPRVIAMAGPKNQFPLAVVFTTLKSAPPDGRLVTFIVNVCAPWLATPESGVVATKTYGQAVGPATKSPQSLINDVVCAKTLKEQTVKTAKKIVLNFCFSILCVKSLLVEIKFII